MGKKVKVRAHKRMLKNGRKVPVKEHTRKVKKGIRLKKRLVQAPNWDRLQYIKETGEVEGKIYDSERVLGTVNSDYYKYRAELDYIKTLILGGPSLLKQKYGTESQAVERLKYLQKEVDRLQNERLRLKSKINKLSEALKSINIKYGVSGEILHPRSPDEREEEGDIWQYVGREVIPYVGYEKWRDLAKIPQPLFESPTEKSKFMRGHSECDCVCEGKYLPRNVVLIRAKGPSIGDLERKIKILKSRPGKHKRNIKETEKILEELYGKKLLIQIGYNKKLFS